MPRSSSSSSASSDSKAAKTFGEARALIAEHRRAMNEAVAASFALADQRAKSQGTTATAGAFKTLSALPAQSANQRKPFVLDVARALTRALRASATSAERGLARELKTARDRVHGAITLGVDNALRAIDEAEIRWNLHCSLAAEGRAPATTVNDLQRSVEAPVQELLTALQGASDRLVERTQSNLAELVSGHVRAMHSMAQRAQELLPSERDRAAARADSPRSRRDKTYFWAVVSTASAAGVATLERERPELLQSLLAAAAVSAAAGVVAHGANNVRLGMPPTEGVADAAWSAAPAGLLTALAGGVMSRNTWVDAVQTLRPLFAKVAPAHLDLVLSGLWQAGGLVLSQLLARAIVVGVQQALVELEGESFDVVRFGHDVGRHAMAFALGDAGRWTALQDHPVHSLVQGGPR